MSMKTTIQNAFGEIIDDRIRKVAWEKAQNDELYIKSNEEYIATYNLLKDSLTTAEQQRLLSKFDSSITLVESIMQDYAYCQGLEDSRMIHEELSKFGISVMKDNFGSTDHH